MNEEQSFKIKKYLDNPKRKEANPYIGILKDLFDQDTLNRAYNKGLIDGLSQGWTQALHNVLQLIEDDNCNTKNIIALLVGTSINNQENKENKKGG